MIRRVAPLVLLAASLAGCGWHLRGSGVTAQGLEDAAIALDSRVPDPALERRVTRELQIYGARVVAADAPADAVVELVGESLGQRVSSVTAGADVRQYDLTYTLRYRVRTPDGTSTGEQRSVIATRTYQADPNDPLVNQSRRDRATEELRAEAVGQLAARIGAALR